MSDELNEDNASLQADEINALSSIYGEDWRADNLEKNVFNISIGSDPSCTVHFQVTLPPSYPLESPPIYQFSAPWMKREVKNRLSAELENCYCEHIGENILFAWIEKIREFVENISKNVVVALEAAKEVAEVLEELTINSVFDEVSPIEHGEPLTDRKSVFQAHVAPVVCVDQVKQVISKLKENRKIASATHNIYAYRILHDVNGTFYQDCEDDGENKAGSILLHLLQILEVHNVIVVVSRWYGGIHLGPDRFKHINSVARDLLEKCGYIKQKPSPTKAKKKR